MAEYAQYILKNWKHELAPEVKDTLLTVANHQKSLMSRLKIILSPKFRTSFFLRTLYGKLLALCGRL